MSERSGNENSFNDDVYDFEQSLRQIDEVFSPLPTAAGDPEFDMLLLNDGSVDSNIASVSNRRATDNTMNEVENNNISDSGINTNVSDGEDNIGEESGVPELMDSADENLDDIELPELINDDEPLTEAIRDESSNLVQHDEENARDGVSSDSLRPDNMPVFDSEFIPNLVLNIVHSSEEDSSSPSSSIEMSEIRTEHLSSPSDNFSNPMDDSNDMLDDSSNDTPTPPAEEDDEAGEAAQAPCMNAVLSSNVQELLNKPKPCYSWNLTSQLMRREYGFSANSRYSMRDNLTSSFNMGFYSSRCAVERMKCSNVLNKHSGCVNSLNFSRDGSLLCSGSDDTRIIIWDWAKNGHKQCFKSGHTQNIFQTKFIDSSGHLDIISTGLDGEVRRSIVSEGGGKPNITTLYSHSDPVHKIVISPQNPNEIISAGEDGRLLHKDLRSDAEVNKLLTVSARLYSVSHHPYAPEVCISGASNSVCVYDKRKFDKPVCEMYPKHLKERRGKLVTCSVYSNSGDEILASYADDQIYLFDNKVHNPGEFLHRYQGHLNQQTIKGVNFFGPNSEYVISGSDCGHVFFWDKNTESILNFIKGDSGVVNCLEPQASAPILAISGLDNSVKVLTPTNPVNPPDLSRLEGIVRRNMRHNILGNRPGSESRFFSLLMRQLLERRNFMMSDNEDGNDDNYNYFLPSSSSSSSSTSDDEDVEVAPQLETFQCRTQ